MFDSIQEAVNDIAAGKLVIVVDDEHRENEGDLVMAAAKATPELLNFMIRNGRGLICAPIAGTIAERLKLAPMVQNNTERVSTNFTISVDYKHGTSTGISAFDRAATVKALADGNSKPEDFLRPGHIFPLRADDGGVAVRPGHTEAAVELARLAGLPPVGVVCEIMDDTGGMARIPELSEYAEKYDLRIIRIRDLISFLGE